MKSFIAKLFLVLAAVSVAVPESQARRLGGGRPIGRQSQTFKRQSTPPPAADRSADRASVPPARPPVRQSQPDYARQSGPQQSPPLRRNGSWGGMLGGALLGFGLGSMLSHNTDQSAAQASGTSGENDTDAINDAGNAGEQTMPVERQGGLGNLFGLGLLAIVVIFLVRRIRRRKSWHQPDKSRLRRF